MALAYNVDPAFTGRSVDPMTKICGDVCDRQTSMEQPFFHTESLSQHRARASGITVFNLHTLLSSESVESLLLQFHICLLLVGLQAVVLQALSADSVVKLEQQTLHRLREDIYLLPVVLQALFVYTVMKLEP
ncbi:hypothetical protein NDU88_000537 [Pleurodeles waltl]|uniref:Uncharacterized protein n=1 Tax=Pleurodeles waltl TaxID=8319 RepID=A0AAV7SXK7_PLEWA|nr:hypothetical protein NDU88_000537 [Pleurodeles waltl]